MSKNLFGMLMILLLTIGLISGCNLKEKSKDIENQGEENKNTTYCISFGNIEKEDFVQELKKINIDKNTLLIGVDTDYSEAAIEQLNQMLKKEGFDFEVMLCRLPDQCLLDGSFLGFVQYLKEEKIPIDILPVWNTDMKGVTDNELLVDLSTKIEKEKDLKEAYPEKFWELTSVDGKNYGMGTFYVSNEGWEVNKELMEKYGFTKEELAKEIICLEDVFDKVTDGEASTDFAAFVYEPRFFLENIPFVYGDVSLPIGYWYGEEKEEQLVNLFDTDKMKELVATMNHYYENGYVKITNGIPEQTAFFMHTDYVGYPSRRSDGLDIWTNHNGVELVRIPYYSCTSNDLYFAVNAITSWSEKQEDAWEFLKFIYTNAEASTLLRYGIEGEDYNMSGDMAIAGGSLSENVIYNRSLGNLQLAPPLSPYEDASKNALVEESLNNLEDSFLTGFAFDTEPIQKEVDAVRGLFMELSTFRTMCAFEQTGRYQTWEDYYEGYCQELKDAGIDQIVDEMNRQLQEYLKK